MGVTNQGRFTKAPSTVSELESREITGNITIQSLKEIAECLNCELHYEFKPKVPVDEQVLNQAIREVENELGEDLNLYSEDDIERDAMKLLKESTILNWQTLFLINLIQRTL